MTVAEGRKPIYCDCCGREVMAWWDGERVLVRDRRHGVRHVAVITAESLTRKPECGKTNLTTE